MCKPPALQLKMVAIQEPEETRHGFKWLVHDHKMCEDCFTDSIAPKSGTWYNFLQNAKDQRTRLLFHISSRHENSRLEKNRLPLSDLSRHGDFTLFDMSRHVTNSHFTLCHVMLGHVTPRHVTLYTA